MKTYPKLIFLAALPLLYLLFAACGGYGDPDFDEDQVMGIVVEESTFSVTERMFPQANTLRTEIDLGMGTVSQLSLPRMGITLVSEIQTGTQKSEDPVVDKIILDKNFYGRGPQWMFIGYSTRESVEMAFPDQFKSVGDQLKMKEKAMLLSFEKDPKTAQMILSQVIIG